MARSFKGFSIRGVYGWSCFYACRGRWLFYKRDMSRGDHIRDYLNVLRLRATIMQMTGIT